MKNSPCSSANADRCTKKTKIKRWTKDLQARPKFSDALLP